MSRRLRTRTLAAAIVAGLATAAVAVVITTGVWPGESEGSQTAGGQIVGSGGSPPSYLEPVSLVAGDFVPSWEAAGLAEQGEAAAIADSEKPQFTGTVGEFRLYGLEQAFADPPARKKACVAVEFPLVDELKFDYLPLGTMARTPQYAGVCEDGSVAFVLQEFMTRNTVFHIGYEPGERAFGHDSSAERVSASTIGGRSAVVIRPPIEEGFGASYVAIATDNGFILVYARELPLSETTKIAEGVQCANC